ncbi:Xylanase inhibitor [Theobroma cacao]|nr:Xylanase inhibitor [Theobroma cacao]
MAKPQLVFANLNKIYFSRAPSSLFKSLPQGISGLAALSRAPIAFSSQFTPPYIGITKKFCNLFAWWKQKSNSQEYHVGLKCISINGRETNFQPNAFSFDSYGNGGVKLSTVVPHTTLRSDVYKNFMKDFKCQTEGIPRAKNGRFGFIVPPIDLGVWKRGEMVDIWSKFNEAGWPGHSMRGLCRRWQDSKRSCCDWMVADGE